MELRKKSNTNENKSIFSTRQERVQMQVDVENISHITSLLTDLYVNPIEATVRETISNAIDTTRRLPKEQRKPITVSLPTEFNPEFVVQDFGEGMDRETLSNVFAQYGASTKGTDLSQIGAFGLGAKAPLSYASKFSVASTKDGITTEVFLSSTSEGNFCDILDSKKTGLPNGTTVTIPVNVDNKYDFVDFEKAVVDNYLKLSFDVAIEVKGVQTPTQRESLPVGDIKVGEVDGKPVYSKLYAIGSNEEAIKGAILLESRFGDADYFVQGPLGYSLSGWDYTPVTHYSTEYYLELVPGMVDFSSSRDEITKNDRFSSVKKMIESQIGDLFIAKQEEIIKTLDWTDMKAVSILRNMSFSRLDDYKVRLDGKTVKEKVLDFNSSVIPLEFALSIPSYRGEYFKLFRSDGGVEYENTITDAKSTLNMLGDYSQTTIERMIFESRFFVVIADLPTEKTEAKRKAMKKSLSNKIRAYNYDKTSDHYSGRNYVATTLSFDEVTELKNRIPDLSSLSVVSYSEIVDVYESTKKTKTKRPKVLSILSSKRDMKITEITKSLGIEQQISYCQKENVLEDIVSKNTTNILVVGETNEYYNDSELARKIFFYGVNNNLESVNLICLRRTALKGEIALNLIEQVDYTVTLCDTSKVADNIVSKLEEKTFENVSVEEEDLLSDLAKQSNNIELFRSYNGFKRLAENNNLDLTLLISQDVIDKLDKVAEYKLTEMEVAYNRVVSSITTTPKEFKKAAMLCESMSKELNTMFSWSYDGTFYSGIKFLDDVNDVVQFAYKKFIPSVKEYVHKELTEL